MSVTFLSSRAQNLELILRIGMGKVSTMRQQAFSRARAPIHSIAGGGVVEVVTQAWWMTTRVIEGGWRTGSERASAGFVNVRVCVRQGREKATATAPCRRWLRWRAKKITQKVGRTRF